MNKFSKNLIIKNLHKSKPVNIYPLEMIVVSKNKVKA